MRLCSLPPSFTRRRLCIEFFLPCSLLLDLPSSFTRRPLCVESLPEQEVQPSIRRFFHLRHSSLSCALAKTILMGKANINIKRGEQCKLRIMEREIIVICTILAPKCTFYQLLWHLRVLCAIVPLYLCVPCTNAQPR